MFRTLKMYFDFADRTNRKKLLGAMLLGVVKAMFAMLKIPAIAAIIQGILDNNMTMTTVWTSFGIMCLSIAGQVLVGLKTTMLQTEAGYDTCALKRTEIGEHLRYLPMGYFNDTSLGHITSVTTNTMEQVGDIATRAIMLVVQGGITTVVIALLMFVFDVRIGFISLAGIGIFLLVNMWTNKKVARVAPEKIESDKDIVDDAPRL